MSVWGTFITFNSFGQVMGFLELWPEDFVGFCKNIFIIGDKHLGLSCPVHHWATEWSRALPRYFECLSCKRWGVDFYHPSTF